MASLTLSHVSKKFGDFFAVDNISLDVGDGEMVALLGGSGCGKTTTLRMIAGFASVTSGDILLDGKRINDLPAYKRNIGIFFQNYALFPHMTTFDNVAFGLKLQKLKKEEIALRVKDMLALVKLSGLEKRYPRELSGGQQQRVALARALVTRPCVLLLDEPLSNLDAKLRAEMQVELKKLQKELKFTTIIVTHDQEEAVSLADRVIVMNGGKLLQTGCPREIFDCPASLYVADFMGFCNFFEGTRTPSNLFESKNGIAVPLSAGTTMTIGTPAVLTIRPENVRVSRTPDLNEIRGMVENVIYKGNVTRLEITGVFEETLYANIRDDASYQPGDVVYVSLPANKLLIYNRE